MKFVKKNMVLLALFLSIYFISCFDVPKDIIVPEWDVDLNVPIINRSYTLKEIIKAQEYITVDTTNDIYLLQSDKYYLNSGVSDFVQFNESSSLNDVPTITSANDSFTVYVKFPEGIEVDSAQFDAGFINLSVTNPTPYDATVTLRFPGFSDLIGNKMTIQTNVIAGGTSSINYNLKGYNYEIPSDQPSNFKNSFKLIVKAVSTQLGNIVYTDLSMSELSFVYVSGLVPSKSLGDKTSSYGFNVSEVEEYREKAFLRDATLNLRGSYLSMYNTPSDLEIRNLNIVAKRNDGREFYLRDNFNNPNFTIRMIDGNYNNAFDQTNSNINDFITFLPDSVILRAEYIVNPENNSGTFANLDSIKFETDFYTRSYLALRSTTIEDRSSIEFTESDRKGMKDGKAADIKFEIENGIPLTTWMTIDLLDENNNYLFTLTNNSEEGDSISFRGAYVDANGEVIEPFVNLAKTITLDETKVQLLAKAHSINYRMSFSTEDSQLDPPKIISIRPSNWIKLKAYGKVTLRVGSDK